MEKMDFVNLTHEDKIDLGQCFDIMTNYYIINNHKESFLSNESKFEIQVISLWNMKQKIKSKLSKFKVSEKLLIDFFNE